LLPARQVPIDAKAAWSLDDTALSTTLSKRTIQDAIYRGELPCIRVGRRVLLLPESVREWLVSRESR